MEGCLVKGAKRTDSSGMGPSTAVRRLGVIASFVASGLVHEYIFWSVRRQHHICDDSDALSHSAVARQALCQHACCVGTAGQCAHVCACRRKRRGAMRRYCKGWVPGVSGGWFTFFAMQGPMLAAESALKRWARRSRRELPLWAAVSLTWAVLLAAADYAFFPPPMKTGLADETVQHLTQAYQQLWARGQAVFKG